MLLVCLKQKIKKLSWKVLPEDEGFQIQKDQGINLRKLDKGCLIFNTEQEEGYMVSVIDTTKAGVEALLGR